MSEFRTARKPLFCLFAEHYAQARQFQRVYALQIDEFVVVSDTDPDNTRYATLDYSAQQGLMSLQCWDWAAHHDENKFLIAMHRKGKAFKARRDIYDEIESEKQERDNSSD